MTHNRGPWGIPVDDPAMDGREMGCLKCGGECVVDCPSCKGFYRKIAFSGEPIGIGPLGAPEVWVCPHCSEGEVPCECQED